MYIPVISTIRHLQLATAGGTPGVCTMQLSELIDMTGVKTARVLARWRGAGADISIKAMKAWPISDIQYAVESAEPVPPAPPGPAEPVIAAEVGLFRSDDYTMTTSGPIDSPGPFIVLFLSFKQPTSAPVELDFTVGIEVLPA